MSKRMRLPNGFGQISQIKGKRLRKPWRAMVTVGKSETGKPICKLLKPESYFETYNDAYTALLEYHKNPYDLSPSITMEELYEKWSKDKFDKLSYNSIKNIKTIWKHCSALYKTEVKTIRARHIKAVVESAPSQVLAVRVKSLFNTMLDYDVEYEITDKNYARDFNVERAEVQSEHVAFTDKEIDKLWLNINSFPYIDYILIQTYMGWRPQELCKIELKNIDLENWTIRAGIKTDAGKDRLVPIPAKIKGLVKHAVYQAQKYKSEYLLICTDGTRTKGDILMTYDKYSKRFKRVIDQLNLSPKHRAHDPRKTFITIAKNKGVDEYAIKYIVGHTITDLTEKVYTERDFEWLRKEINKI